MDISTSLQRYFDQHRIVFWYDSDDTMKEEFDNTDIPSVTKIIVENNEFAIKHRIMREEAENKFLLYFPHDVPPKQENWLLDVLLAHHQFQTSQEAIYMQDIGMDYQYKELVSTHLEFFKSKDRRAKFSSHFSTTDTEAEIINNMLAVVFKTDAVRLEEFLLSYIFLYEHKDEEILKELARYHLSDKFWKSVTKEYHYSSDEPTLYGFILELFKTNHSLSDKAHLSRDSKVLLDRWKRDSKGVESFEYFSKRVTEDLQIKSKLPSEEFGDILKDNLYEVVDRFIIKTLRDRLIAKDISHSEVEKVIKERENKSFYQKESEFYLTVLFASQLIEEVKVLKTQFDFNTFSDGVNAYTQSLYRVDFAYRKFLENYRKTNQNSGFNALKELAHSTYSNDWLLELSNKWQAIVDREDKWNEGSYKKQSEFFSREVEPLLKKGQTVCVVISDAFRYEIGHELNEKLEKEKRFKSTLSSMVTNLPSYTAIGMASLLPHTNLEIKENSNVNCDGMSSVGRDARTKILNTLSDYPSVAIKASDIIKMTSQEGREFKKPYKLIYIYHDLIDATGDDKKTEDGVIEASSQTIEDLYTILTSKLYNMNCYTNFVTADHGFIYQADELHETDFSECSKEGNHWKLNRRFVIGTDLQEDTSNKHYTSEEASLKGNAELLIPKSINRLRVKGSGSKFVHGGATLQEIVVPMLRVFIKKEDTVQKVDIEIIRNADRITTNIKPISFFQKELVDSKNLPRTIRAKFWDEEKTRELSDEFVYTFDKEEGVERQREVKKTFNLSATASSDYNNKKIYLVLEEPIEGANEWKEYARFGYTLMLSVANDFDDWD